MIVIQWPRQFVKEILMDIVGSVISSNANILKSPGPSGKCVFLLGFGPDSIDFEIRGILRDVKFNYFNSIKRSDINFEYGSSFVDLHKRELKYHLGSVISLLKMLLNWERYSKVNQEKNLGLRN